MQKDQEIQALKQTVKIKDDLLEKNKAQIQKQTELLIGAFIEVPDGLVTDIDIEKFDPSQPYEDKDFPTTYSSFI